MPGSSPWLWPHPLSGRRSSSAPQISRIGYLALRTTSTAEIQAFRDGLRELGYVERQTVAIELHLMESPEQGFTPAAELVNLPVDLIVTWGSTGDTQAAMDATRTIPIVFAAAPDPVPTGYVASLVRPGGNVTGLSALAPQVNGKRLQLLDPAVPPGSGH